MRGLLSNLAQHLKSKVDNGVISCIGPYQNTLSEIARIDREAVKGAQVRARVQWVEEGETSSAFFSRLSKYMRKYLTGFSRLSIYLTQYMSQQGRL